MLAFATVIPVTGWAADRFGTKRLFMGSVLLFMLGSLLCAISPTIMLLIIFRVIQGVGGGMLMPLSFVILTHEAGPKRIGRLMARNGRSRKQTRNPPKRWLTDRAYFSKSSVAIRIAVSIGSASLT